MNAVPLTISEYGDGAVMVTVRDLPEQERRRAIREFRQHLLAEPPPGLEDIVSGLESLLVEFDPLRTTAEQVAYSLGALGRAEPIAGEDSAPPRRLIVPIVVDPATAPDLADVAHELGISEPEVIEGLESSELTIALLAAAMAPMMDGLVLPQPVRRQATPRTNVAEGSIMIAGRNAIIQPFPGPTGWRVIGRTPLRIVDIARDAPVSFGLGDKVVFRRIDPRQAAELDGEFLEAEA